MTKNDYMDWIKIKKFTIKKVKRQCQRLRADICKMYIQQRTNLYQYGVTDTSKHQGYLE